MRECWESCACGPFRSGGGFWSILRGEGSYHISVLINKSHLFLFWNQQLVGKTVKGQSLVNKGSRQIKFSAKLWILSQRGGGKGGSPLSPNGSLFRDPGPFLVFWVPIGSLFIFQGLYFQCFGIIHAKNVNLVCMYTTMSYLDLSVMSNDLNLYHTYHPLCCEVMLHTLELFPNFDFYVCYVGYSSGDGVNILVDCGDSRSIYWGH